MSGWVVWMDTSWVHPGGQRQAADSPSLPSHPPRPRMCAEGRVQAQPRPGGRHSPLDAHGLGALDEGHLALPVHIVCVLLRPRGGAVDDGVHAHQRRRQ